MTTSSISGVSGVCISHPNSPETEVFSMLWNTRSKTTASLPLRSGLTYDCVIYWGDGNSTSVVGTSPGTITHDYGVAGEYQIEISGEFQGFRFNNSGDRLSVKRIDSWGPSVFQRIERFFFGCNNIEYLAPGIKISPEATSWESAFKGLKNIVEFPFMDSSMATNLSNTWYDCRKLVNFPSIDISNAQNLTQAWQDCRRLTSFPALDTSSCTTLSRTWYNCINLISFPLISIPLVTTIKDAWRNCNALASFPAIAMPEVVTADLAWSNCYALSSFPAIDFPKATTLNNTWSGCSSLVSFLATGLSASTKIGPSNLDAPSLNTIYSNLATVSGQTLDVSGNPGTGNHNPSIATAKGWTVLV